MTTQSCISGQSIGTGSNIGDAMFSINPKTLAAGTTAYIVNVQTTLPTTGAAVPDQAQAVRVWYTTTIRTVTAASAPHTLRQTARYVDIRFGRQAGRVMSVDSALEPKTGSNFHCWCEIPTLGVAATLDVDLVEVPS